MGKSRFNNTHCRKSAENTPTAHPPTENDHFGNPAVSVWIGVAYFYSTGAVKYSFAPSPFYPGDVWAGALMYGGGNVNRPIGVITCGSYYTYRVSRIKSIKMPPKIKPIKS